MKMIRENREPQQIDPKGGGELLQVVFDPDFAVIKVFARKGIVSHQETAADGAIKDMSNRHFARIKDFSTSQTDHRVTAGKGVRKAQQNQSYRYWIPIQPPLKCSVPIFLPLLDPNSTPTKVLCPYFPSIFPIFPLM